MKSFYNIDMTDLDDSVDSNQFADVYSSNNKQVNETVYISKDSI